MSASRDGGAAGHSEMDAISVLQRELSDTKQLWLLDRRRVQSLHQELASRK